VYLFTLIAVMIFKFVIAATQPVVPAGVQIKPGLHVAPVTTTARMDQP